MLSEAGQDTSGVDDLQADNRDSLELSTDYAPPTTEIETRLADLYSRVFNVAPVGIDDDFFELGGDSLTAATLSSGLASEFGFEIKPSRFVEISTIRLLAEMLDEASEGKEPPLPPNLSVLNGAGTRPPLFMIHGAGGNVFPWPEFLAGLSDDQPVYLFQARGYDGTEETFDNIPDIATAYLRSVLDISPSGPWHIIAFCGGSWIAVEMTRQMALERLRPANVILLDPMIPKVIRDDYRERRIARIARIPGVARALSRVSADTISLVSRMNFYLRTGVMSDPRAAEAIADPKVLEAMIALEMPKPAGKRGMREEAPRAGDPPKKSYTATGRALTTVKLKHAIRQYGAEVIDQPVIIIGSEKLKRQMRDVDHPINRLLPNNTFMVSGDTHADAVANARSAALIQEIIGDAAAQ